MVYTEVLQTGLLLLGSFFITFFGLSKPGRLGRDAGIVVAQSAPQFALWRPMSDPEFPWLGVVIASPIVGIWYWCTDQYIVQRTLSAKSLKDARRGADLGRHPEALAGDDLPDPRHDRLRPPPEGLLRHAAAARTARLTGDQVFPTWSLTSCRSASAGWWSAACCRP